MKLTESLWASITDIYSRTLAHPFLQGLADGSLDEDAFRYYVIQDALYLRDFARGLALMAAKSNSDDSLLMFCDHARNALLVERSLHDGFFVDWSLTPAVLAKFPSAPNNLLYTSYLLRVAHERPFHEGLGAFLPCYWIYWEVGKVLEKKGSPRELYQRWINTYASEQFAGIVRQILDLADQIGEGLTDSQKAAVVQHFVMTSRLEYLFWDMAYRKQTWSI